MHEQSKAAKRRFDDGNFHNRYFIGRGIDIGCGVDSLNNLRHVFRGIQEVKAWDLPDGDAQYMATISDNQFDFVTSSHCLEHMKNPYEALNNWIRICKPNGYLVITIPDREMYEQGNWPSIYNDDHKFTFSMKKFSNPENIYVLEFLHHFAINNIITVEKIEVIRDFYYENIPPQDQTFHPCIESCIEIILKKL